MANTSAYLMFLGFCQKHRAAQSMFSIAWPIFSVMETDDVFSYRLRHICLAVVSPIL